MHVGHPVPKKLSVSSLTYLTASSVSNFKLLYLWLNENLNFNFSLNGKRIIKSCTICSNLGKMRKRGCIVTKLLAKMLCKSGFTHIITMDLHAKEIQGFFDVPIDNLRASPFLLQYIQECVSSFCHYTYYYYQTRIYFTCIWNKKVLLYRFS